MIVDCNIFLFFKNCATEKEVMSAFLDDLICEYVVGKTIKGAYFVVTYKLQLYSVVKRIFATTLLCYRKYFHIMKKINREVR